MENVVYREKLRDMAVDYALKFVGLPYRWGGDDPIQGFDCSGFVIEVGKAFGLLPRDGDWTAHSLRDMWKSYSVGNPYKGCCVFYGRQADDRIIHIEFCLDHYLAVGASGGGSATVTIENAIQRNAYIKIRPIKSRSNIRGYADPFQIIA